MASQTEVYNIFLGTILLQNHPRKEQQHNQTGIWGFWCEKTKVISSPLGIRLTSNFLQFSSRVQTLNEMLVFVTEKNNEP